jgi:hypothetical protein
MPSYPNIPKFSKRGVIDDNLCIRTTVLLIKRITMVLSRHCAEVAELEKRLPYEWMRFASLVGSNPTLSAMSFLY